MEIVRRFWRESAVIAIWIIAVIAKLKYNGLIFGFDYGLYQPDGNYYTYQTLKYLGNGSQNAGQQVADWYSIHAAKNQFQSAQAFLPETNPAWGVVSQRVLYPFLSIPFVAAIGIPGMLVIPAISLLVIMLVTLSLGRTYKVPNFGLILALVLTCSQTVMRWMLVNCTDALLTGLFGLAVLILAKNIWNKVSISFLFLICAAASFTRICVPIWILIATTLYFQKKKLIAIFIALFSIILSIPTLFSAPSNAILPSSTEASGQSKLLYLPVSFLKIMAFEFAELAVLDRVLLFLIFLSLALSLKHWRHSSAMFFFAVFFATFAIGAINGELGVNYRYQLPQLPFMAWVIIQGYANLISTDIPSKLDVHT